MHATGDDLRALRRTRGLTLAEAAGRVGRSVGWLSQVERGRSTPEPDDLVRLADALDAPLSLLAPRGPEAERGRRSCAPSTAAPWASACRGSSSIS